MASDHSHNSISCCLDGLQNGTPSTITAADVVGSSASDETGAASVRAASSVLLHSPLATSVTLNELRSPLMRSATLREPTASTPHTHGTSGNPNTLENLLTQQSRRTPLLSPVGQILPTQLYTLSSSGAVDTSYGAHTVFAVDNARRQPTSSGNGSSPQSLAVCGNVVYAEAGAATGADLVSPVLTHGDGNRAPDTSSSAAVGAPLLLPPPSPTTCGPAYNRYICDIVKSRSCSSSALAHDGADVLVGLPHPEPHLSLTAGVHSRGSSVLPAAQASSSSVFSATTRSLPTRMSRMSSIAHTSRVGAGGASGGGPQLRSASGSESSPHGSAAPLAAASSPLATQPVTLASEHLLSSVSSHHRLSRSTGFFQSGLLLSLEEDAEAQPMAMDAPMTPQSFSNLVRSRGNSARQSLMSSRHFVTLGGEGSFNSTTNTAPANAGVSGGGGFPPSSSQRPVLGTPGNADGWTAGEEVGGLRTLDDNGDSDGNVLQQWGGNAESYGAGNINANTPFSAGFSGRFGGTGGGTAVTPFGSFRLMSSHDQLCTSAVDPSDIPATPRDLSHLPCASRTHAMHRDHRVDYSDDGSTASPSDDEEADDPEPEVLETNTLQRACATTADGHSAYEVINEKYVLYHYELGRGSYSRVHLCYCLSDKRFYAAKVLDKVRLKRRQLGAEYDLFKIDQEITIMKQLQHRNIIGLREVIRDPNARYVFLIMDLAEGKEVLKMRDNGDVVPMANGRTNYPEAAVRHFTRGVLSALMYAHYLGIAHRDVKPSNVLTTAQNVVKLCDFGVSVLVGNFTMQLRREGSVAFLAPELLLSNEVDVSRFVSPALSSLGASRDKAESRDGARSESLRASTFNAAAEMLTSLATELTEEVRARQDTDEWDLEASANQLLPSSASATGITRQSQRNPQTPCYHAVQSHPPNLVTPTTARQTSVEFSEQNGSRVPLGAAALASTSGASPSAALSAAGPQRSFLASKLSLRTSSVSSRANATAAASGGAGAIQQYVAWLSETSPHSTVDLFKGDVFSLGVTVFTLLLGRLPWRASSASSQLAAVLEEPDPFLRLYREAYGKEYTWPPAVSEACAPILAFARQSSNSHLRRGGPAALYVDVSASCVSSFAQVEREGSGRHGTDRRVMTPLEARTVTTEDDDEADEAEEGAHSRSEGNDVEKPQAFSSTHVSRRGVSAPALPPTSNPNVASMFVSGLHRTYSLDTATVTQLKNISPRSSNLRSSKAGCTPDADLITTTTLSTWTGQLLQQGTTSNSSGTICSRGTPRVVTASAHGIIVGSDSASSPAFGSGTVLTQHENSGHCTASSPSRSATDSGAVVLADVSGGSELPAALTLHDAGTQWSSSQMEQLGEAVVALCQQQRQKHPLETGDVAAAGAVAESRSTGPDHQTLPFPIPQWSAVVDNDAGSLSERSNTSSTSNTHTEERAATTMSYQYTDSAVAARVPPPPKQPPQQLPLQHTADSSSRRPSMSRRTSDSVEWAGYAAPGGSEGQKGGRRPRDGSLPSALPPLAASALTAAPRVDGESSLGGDAAFAQAEENMPDYAAAQRYDETNLLIAHRGAYAAVNLGDDDDDDAVTTFSEEEDAAEVSVRALHCSVHDDTAAPEVAAERITPDSGHYGVAAENLHSESDDNDDNDDDDDDDDALDDNIYEQLYEEGHPCRPYTVAETRPLPVLGGDDDEDGDGSSLISAAAVDFVRACLQLDPGQRRTVFELFRHPWISDVSAADKGSESRLHHHQYHHNRGLSSFTGTDDDEDGNERKEGSAGDGDTDRANSAGRRRTEREEDGGGMGQESNEAEPLLNGRGERKGDAVSTSLRTSPSPWGVASTTYDGSCFSAVDVVLDDDGEHGLRIDTTVKDISPVDVVLPHATESVKHAEGVTGAPAESSGGDGGGSSASADSATVFLSADSENAVMACTNSSLVATGATVNTTNGNDDVVVGRTATTTTSSNHDESGDTGTADVTLRLRRCAEDASTPSAFVLEMPHSAPCAPPLPVNTLAAQQAVVVPLRHFTKDLLETVTVQHQLNAQSIVQHHTPLFSAYGIRSSDFTPSHYARHTSSASSWHQALNTPCVEESNFITPSTGDRSATATPTTGATHHRRPHNHFLPGRDARGVADGASLHSPVLDDASDRLLLSVVSPSSHSTTLNLSSTVVGQWNSARVATDQRCVPSSSPRQASRRSGKATTMTSHCTVSSSSAATASSAPALNRPALAATTSHVDSVLRRASSDRPDYVAGRSVGVLYSSVDEEDGDGDGEELSTMTAGSLQELISSLPHTCVAGSADVVRLPSVEEEPPGSHPVVLPLMQPPEEGALLSPMRRFLEKISLRDQPQE